MTAFDAFILGLVEGLTEFLPVSSTGHLLITQRVLGLPDDEASRAFAICIQAGAIVAVAWVYAARLRGVFAGLAGRDPAGLSLLRNLVVAFLPAAVVGLLFDERIERVLFGPWPIVVSWTVGAIVILRWASHPRLQGGPGGQPIDSLHWRGALIVGLFQCIALWPGTSRSLVTILGGAVAGLSFAATIEFSFLLGLLTLGAATAWKLLDDGAVLFDTYGAAPLAVGFVSAAVSAFAAIRWMLGWLNRRGLALFAWWRLAAAAGVAAMLLSGRWTA